LGVVGRRELWKCEVRLKLSRLFRQLRMPFMAWAAVAMFLKPCLKQHMLVLQVLLLVRRNTQFHFADTEWE
jgi:hypothetical protein